MLIPESISYEGDKSSLGTIQFEQSRLLAKWMLNSSPRISDQFGSKNVNLVQSCVNTYLNRRFIEISEEEFLDEFGGDIEVEIDFFELQERWLWDYHSTRNLRADIYIESFRNETGFMIYDEMSFISCMERFQSCSPDFFYWFKFNRGNLQDKDPFYSEKFACPTMNIMELEEYLESFNKFLSGEMELKEKSQT